MKPTAYAVPGKKRAREMCAAFAQGCRGRWLEFDGHLRDGPAAFYGYTMPMAAAFAEARTDGRDWYYMDNAYFRRKRYWRVTRNAMWHDGAGSAGRERFSQLGLRVWPWRKSGRSILIALQTESFFALQGLSRTRWLRDVIAVLRACSERPITVREKPPHNRLMPPPEILLRDVWAVVAYTSNTAVDAVLHGVPAFVTHPCPAAAMSSGALAAVETPAYPERREQWAWNLAANQWTVGEIRAGLCWRTIGR